MSASASSSSSSPPDAAVLFKQGDFLGALKAYQAALAAGGDPGPLQRNLAAVYLRLELWSSALEAAMACLALLPDDGKAKYRVAQALLGLNSFVAAWIWLRTVCVELLRPSDGSKAPEWARLELQCLKGLGLTLLHEAVDVVEDAPGRFSLVCRADVAAGTVLLQEARHCRNREQDDTHGGLQCAVRFVSRIRDEGGLAKYEREFRGLRPANRSQLSHSLWEEACAAARAELKPPAAEGDVASVALLALQFNAGRFEDSLYRLTSFLSHSCAPNCDRVVLPNHDISIVALHPITAGQPFTVSALSVEGLLAGVHVRQHLLRPRLDGPCHCVRCEEDLGLRPGVPTGELVRCATPACPGYVGFPQLHEPEGASSLPCPHCGCLRARTGLSAEYTVLMAGLRPFIRPCYLSAFEVPLPADGGAGKGSAAQGLQGLQALLAAGEAVLHPQHHLLRLGRYTALRLAHAVFGAQYEVAFGQRGLQKACPDEFLTFIRALEDVRLLPTVECSLRALTTAAEGASAPPVAVQCHALKDFHALVVDAVCVFAAERHLPAGYAGLEQLEAVVQAHLPHCTAKVQAAAKQVLEVLRAEDAGELASSIEAEKAQAERRAQRRELEMDQDDVGEQEAIAELLKQISAKMKSGGLKDGL